MSCPRCDAALVETPRGKLRVYACPQDHGALLPHGSRPALTFAARAALEDAEERPRADGLPCGACGTRTQQVVAARHGDHIELDSCRACGAAWFDAGELERLEARGPRGAPTAAAPAAGRAMGLAGGGMDAVVGGAGIAQLLFGFLDGW